MTVYLLRSPRLWWRMLAPLLLMVVAPLTILIYSLVRGSEPSVRYYNCVIPEFVNSAERLGRDHHIQSYLVPNTVHVYMPLGEGDGGREGLSARDESNLLSMYRVQQPESLVIHTDKPQKLTETLTRSGVGRQPGLWRALRVQEWPTPQHVFGLPFSEEYREQHISDLVRLRILRRYGGIFIDIGVEVISNLNWLRKHELVLFEGENVKLDIRVILAHRDSPALHEWIKSYSHYNPTHPRHHQTSLVENLLTSLESHNSSVKFVFSEYKYIANTM